MRDAAGQVTELYRQDTTFCLPPGFKKPWPSSTLEFSRPDGRRVVLQIEDSHQQIGRIEIHLKDTPGVEPGLVQRIVEDPDRLLGGDPPPPQESDIVLIVEDGPVLCPPICPG